MINVVIVGLGEAGKSCYRILAPIKELNVKNINTPIKSIDTLKKILHCEKINYAYDYLVICTGASPKVLEKQHPNVKTTRDFNSIQELAGIAKSSNRIAMLGNGGVSLEVANEFRHMELLWIFKDNHIGKDFFDTETCKYFYPFIFKKSVPNKNDVWAYTNTDDSPDLSVSSTDVSPDPRIQRLDRPLGPALGPVWKDSFRHFVQIHHDFEHFRDIKFEPECTIEDILTREQVDLIFKKRIQELTDNPEQLVKEKPSGWNLNEIMDFEVPPSKIHDLYRIANDDILRKDTFKIEQYPLYLKLTNGKIYGVDYLICGLGVTPNTRFLKRPDPIKTSKEGGIIVDHTMKTSVDYIYAAGDVATIEPIEHNFIQKRLWSQARVMGIAAAQSIIKSITSLKYEIPNSATSLIHFCMLPSLSSTMIHRYFNHFVHVTSFFGLRAIFLGKYNGQGLNYTTEFYSAGNGLVKYVLTDGKIRGAILVGETGLEVIR